MIVDQTGDFNVTLPKSWNFQDQNGKYAGVYSLYFVFDLKTSMGYNGVFNISLMAEDKSTLLRTSINGTDNTITMLAFDSSNSQLDIAKYEAVKGLESYLPVNGNNLDKLNAS